MLIHALFIAFILEIFGQVFEGFQNFGYLGTLINSKNLISDKIKPRKAAGGNICFCSLGQIFRCTAVSKEFKLRYIKQR